MSAPFRYSPPRRVSIMATETDARELIEKHGATAACLASLPFNPVGDLDWTAQAYWEARTAASIARALDAADEDYPL